MLPNNGFKKIYNYISLDYPSIIIILGFINLLICFSNLGWKIKIARKPQSDVGETQKDWFSILLFTKPLPMNSCNNWRIVSLLLTAVIAGDYPNKIWNILCLFKHNYLWLVFTDSQQRSVLHSALDIVTAHVCGGQGTAAGSSLVNDIIII